jgi:hypothetical protein
MAETVLHRRGTTLVRRLRLAPGAAMPWHSDPFERVTVVLRGDALAIEYRDGGPSERIALAAGQVDWTSRPRAFTAPSTSARSRTRRSRCSFSTIRTRCRSRSRPTIARKIIARGARWNTAQRIVEPLDQL